MRYLTFALAKGRLADKTLSLFEQIGITCEEMKDKSSRKLIFTNEELGFRFFLAKAGDVPTYVSSGAFADEDFKQQAILTASENNGRICIVNGAIGGLDFLQTCALQRGSAEVIIETTKSPKSLLGAPGLDGRTLDLTKRTVVFEGGVQEAIKGFPKNINVGVIASLASQKPQTKVRIVADPAANSNTHQITYRSALADAVMEFSGKPDPANPKSSTTAALSAAACLKNLYSPITFW